MNLDDGSYVISNNGANLLYGGIANREADLPNQGHPIKPRDSWIAKLDVTGAVYLWPDGESGSCDVAISPA